MWKVGDKTRVFQISAFQIKPRVKTNKINKVINLSDNGSAR